MQDKVYRCSFLANARVGNSPTSYADDSFYVSVKEVDRCYKGQLLHTHTFFEFDLVLAGRGINVSKDGEREVGVGDIIFGTPASIHGIYPCEGNNLTLANIAFKGQLEKMVVEALDTLDGFVMRLSDEDFEFICSELDNIIGFPIKDSKKRKMFVDGSAQKILAVVSEAYEKSGLRSKETNAEARVHSAIIYIMKNYNKPIKIGDVAKHVGYSSDYISTLLKKATRMSFSSYLLTLRLENAFLLLMENEMSIGEICNEVGYSSYSNFYYAFKKRFGIIPGEVSKRSRSENAECFAKNCGQQPLVFDENNKLIWRYRK